MRSLINLFDDLEIPALSRMYKKAQKKGKFDSEFELETGRG